MMQRTRGGLHFGVLEESLPPVESKDHGEGVDYVSNFPLRTAVRFPMKLSLALMTPKGLLKATTENISANGILFSGCNLPEVNSRIEFTINMPAAIMGSQEDVTIHCLGRVVRHQGNGGKTQAAAIIDEYFMRA